MMTMLRLRDPYLPPIFGRSRAIVRVGSASVSGSSPLMEEYSCSDSDSSEKNKANCKRMIVESLNKWVRANYGDPGDTVSWKKAFLARATVDANGMYWYSKTFQDLLSELGACPPSGAFSGPDCDAAGIDLVKAFAGVQTDADGQFRAYWPDFLIKMDSPKLKPLPEDTGPTDPGWIGRPVYGGNAEKVWRIALGKTPPIPTGAGGGGAVEYEEQEVLTDVVDHVIRAIYDFVRQQQFDVVTETFHDRPFDAEFASFGTGGSTCLNRYDLAVLIMHALSAASMRGYLVHLVESDGSPVPSPQMETIADRLLDKYDVDRDGCLTPDEYLKSLKSIEKSSWFGLLRALLSPIDVKYEAKGGFDESSGASTLLPKIIWLLPAAVAAVIVYFIVR